MTNTNNKILSSSNPKNQGSDKVPVLRFPEFEGEWEKKKLGEVATNKSGKYNPEKEINSVRCIELEHLGQENAQLLGYIDGKNSGSIKNKFDKGDVLFGKLRPYLKKYLLAPFDGVCSSEIWVLKGINISNDFLFRIIQTDNFIDLANQSSGSKMPRADWSVVENGLFSFPTLPEQTKIASFLTAVDEKIQALKKKKSLLEQYKKGVMQKLFSQELRFKPVLSVVEGDENGNDFPEWEVKKLGEVCEIIMGQSPSSNSYNSDEIGVPLIQGNADIQNRISNPRNWTTEKTKECYIGDLILTVRAPVGAVAKSVHKACIGRGVCAIRNNTKSVNEYIYQFLLDYETKWSSLEQGSTFTAVSGVEIKKLEISFPCLQEQTAIANFLSALDEKINQTQTQIQKTEVWKKGLLQKMFV